MRPVISTALVAIVCMLAAGCATTAPRVDPTFAGPLNRVFVLIKGDQELLEPLAEAIEVALREEGIAAEAYMQGNLSLDTPTEIQARIASFEPDVVLNITQTSDITRVGRKQHAHLDLTVHPLGTDNLIWRSTTPTQASAYPYGPPDTAEDQAARIVKQMRKDGLLRFVGAS